MPSAPLSQSQTVKGDLSAELWRRTWRVPLVGFGLSKQREILGLFAVETLWRTLKFTFILVFFHPLQCEAYLCAEEATCADLSAPQVGEWNPSRHTFPCFFWLFTAPSKSLPLSESGGITDQLAEMSANERSTRAFREILQKPGNDACADCGAPGRLGEKKEGAFISYESGKSDYAGSMITLLVKSFIKVHLNVSFVLCYSRYGIELNACLDL